MRCTETPLLRYPAEPSARPNATRTDSTDLQFGLDTVLDFIRYGTTPRRMVYSRAVRVLLCRAVYCRVLCIRSSHRVL